MPLNWQQVHITAAGGMDEATAARVRAPTSLEVRNGHWKRTGEVVKRNGFDQLGVTTASGTIEGARGLFSTGDELCIIGKRKLWARNDQAALWYDRGVLGPCALRSRRLFRDQQAYYAGDLAVGDGYVVSAAVSYSTTDNTSGANVTTTTLWANIESTGGSTTIAPTFTGLVAGTSAATRPFGPRVCGPVGNLFILFYGFDTATPGTLRRQEWNSSTPTTDWTASANVTTDLWVNAASSQPNTRSYDAVPVSGGTYVVAWIDNTAQEIEIRRFNTSHVQQATATITAEAPFSRVAVCDDPSLNQIYVLAVADNGGSADEVLLYGFARTDLSAIFGPVTLRTLDTADEIAETIGVASNGSRVVGTWTVHNNATTTNATRLESRSTSNAGADLDTMRSHYNLFTRSKPFWYDGRAYVAAITTQTMHVYSPTPTTSIFAVGAAALQTDAFDSAVLLDLYVNETNPGTTGRQPALVGVWDVGVAPPSWNSGAMQIGNGNAVYEESTGVYRMASLSSVYNLANQFPKFSVDELVLNFTEAPLATVGNRGNAIIGGSLVSSYDGRHCVELAVVCPPMPYSISGSDTGTGGLTPGDTYQWICTLEMPDAKGNLIRSLPSPPVTYTLQSGGTPHDTAALRAKTVGPSNRVRRYQESIVWYRLDDEAVYRRVTESHSIIANGSDTSYLTATWFDINQDDGPLLYTQSGEIENVCPEGARIVATGIGRIWLGDLVRGDRVQYSKPIAAGTAFEDAIAPEFNEGFGYLLESGERVTGIGELDDKMVVFTEKQVYLIAGRGPDDAGAANDFSGLVLVSNDAGCIDPRSVCGYPGGVFFQSKAGIYRIDRALGIEFVGQSVRDTLESFPVVTSAVLVPKATQVRFTCTNAAGSDGIVLVFDYLHNTWARWNVKRGAGSTYVPIGACVHNDLYHMVDSSGRVARESTSSWKDDSTNYVAMRVEMGWLQPAGRMGWAATRRYAIDGRAADAHQLTVTYFCDHEAVAAESATVFTWAQLSAFESITTREQPTIHPGRSKAQACKIRIEDAEDGTTASTTGEGYVFDGITFEVGAKRRVPFAPAANMR